MSGGLGSIESIIFFTTNITSGKETQNDIFYDYEGSLQFLLKVAECHFGFLERG